MSEQKRPRPGIGERHPVLAILLIVFAGGAVGGAIITTSNRVLGGLLGGVGGVVMFLLLSFVLAGIITLVQLSLWAVRRRAPASHSVQNLSLARRFKRNFEGATELWIQGWQ
jgi:hypothetical protein